MWNSISRSLIFPLEAKHHRQHLRTTQRSLLDDRWTVIRGSEDSGSFGGVAWAQKTTEGSLVGGGGWVEKCPYVHKGSYPSWEWIHKPYLSGTQLESFPSTEKVAETQKGNRHQNLIEMGLSLAFTLQGARTYVTCPLQNGTFEYDAPFPRVLRCCVPLMIMIPWRDCASLLGEGSFKGFSDWIGFCQQRPGDKSGGYMDGNICAICILGRDLCSVVQTALEIFVFVWIQTLNINALYLLASCLPPVLPWWKTIFGWQPQM